MYKLAFACLLAIAFQTVNAETLSGRIVAVADGDTVTLLTQDLVQYKIRLAGIDAPEKTQPYGQRSKQSLSELVYDRLVQVDTDKTDRYGRQVGKILVGELDANLEQIRRGMAWHYKANQREQLAADRETYSAAEVEAKGRKVGLWADPAPTPPWEFRHGGISK